MVDFLPWSPLWYYSIRQNGISIKYRSRRCSKNAKGQSNALWLKRSVKCPILSCRHGDIAATQQLLINWRFYTIWLIIIQLTVKKNQQQQQKKQPRSVYGQRSVWTCKNEAPDYISSWVVINSLAKCSEHSSSSVTAG